MSWGRLGRNGRRARVTKGLACGSWRFYTFVRTSSFCPRVEYFNVISLAFPPSEFSNWKTDYWVAMFGNGINFLFRTTENWWCRLEVLSDYRANDYRHITCIIGFPILMQYICAVFTFDKTIENLKYTSRKTFIKQLSHSLPATKID